MQGTSLILRENRDASYQDILPINEHLKEYDVVEFCVSPCLRELNSSHVKESVYFKKDKVIFISFVFVFYIASTYLRPRPYNPIHVARFQNAVLYP